MAKNVKLGSIVKDRTTGFDKPNEAKELPKADPAEIVKGLGVIHTFKRHYRNLMSQECEVREYVKSLEAALVERARLRIEVEESRAAFVALIGKEVTIEEMMQASDDYDRANGGYGR